MEELEVYFCDLCGTSVPEADVDVGKAVRIKGKLVGGCCAAELRPAAASGSTGTAAGSPRPAGSGGIVTAVFVVLVAVAASAMFLEWRFNDVADGMSGRVGSIRESVDNLDGRMVRIESRLHRTVMADDLGKTEGLVIGLRDTFEQREARLTDSLAMTGDQMRALETRLKSIGEAQSQSGARFADVMTELREVSREVAAIKAMPRAAPREERVGMPAAMPTSDVEVAAPTLPPEIAHEVERLGDADAGTRFEAVDELLQKRDERAYEFILPLARDADPFVRRLVVEGLGDYRNGAAVDALLVALADPEGIVRHTAFTSLKQLTEQNIRFDPDASADQRSAMQKRWQQWWDKNREGFF